MQLECASDRLFYIYQASYDCEEFLDQQNWSGTSNPIPASIMECINKFRLDIRSSMSDDLHTPVALAALSDPLKNINDLLHRRSQMKRQELRVLLCKRKSGVLLRFSA